MKQEDKELLLKDLCARLPYGVKVKSSRRRSLVTLSLDVMTDFHLGCSVNPYLRPLSSMTEEEKLMYEGLMIGTDNVSYMLDVIDWLYEHHFDVRHLIEKNLAIEVTEENNPYKE